MAVSVVATLWLAATGQLVLYIHPRYIVFTVVMAVIGLVLVIASVRSTGRDSRHDGDQAEHGDHDHGDHDHDDHGASRPALAVDGHAHDHPPTPAPSRMGRTVAVTGSVLTLAIAGSLIVLPPATLSAATADQRDINSTALSAETTSVADATGSSDAAFATFTVLDWASLLRQTSDTAFYKGKPVDVVGFISADPDDPENVFYVSRFIVTCCAVDAQPVGLPVYLPDWQNGFALDDWVEVSGEFTPNPTGAGSQAVVLVPDDIAVVDQPAEPYLF
ncbi:MAG: hypothetical protein RI885_1817 [Actinomycetota bacterium]|jgi:uncharacterized repeat protein (TIGR03943 family)